MMLRLAWHPVGYDGIGGTGLPCGQTRLNLLGLRLALALGAVAERSWRLPLAEAPRGIDAVLALARELARTLSA